MFNKTKKAADETKESEKNEILIAAELEDMIEETQTGIIVEKVIDENPGELEISEEDKNTFNINSIEDLIFFSYDVNAGNTYNEKNVKLNTSLDFNSSKSYVDITSTKYSKYGYNGGIKQSLKEKGFTPIGDATGEHRFQGTFDGNGNKIYNLKLQQTNDISNIFGIGMFRSNKGTIKNLGIENAEVNININDNNWTNVGILAGTNDGMIQNCYAIGKIDVVTKVSSNIGGLVGTNIGTIEQCYTNIEMDVTQDGLKSILRLGGLVGMNEMKAEDLNDVYSRGNIIYLKKNMKECFLGGISGFNGINANTGYSTIEINLREGGFRTVNTVGDWWEKGVKSSNFYYLPNKIFSRDICVDAYTKSEFGEEVSEDEMKSQDFVDKLNEDNKNIWKKDNKNINQGYPIFIWQDNS